MKGEKSVSKGKGRQTTIHVMVGGRKRTLQIGGESTN
jgi:hypothetical protein